LTIFTGSSHAEKQTAAAAQPEAAAVEAKPIKPACDKALTWLTEHQQPSGAWGKEYTIAVTSFACLSYLGHCDEPFSDDANGRALLNGLKYLLSKQKEGMFENQGHTWIHGQGFATLALAEAYGRGLLCKNKPDLDSKALKQTITQAIKVIEVNQSTSGGWWYRPGSKSQHEGSTTVTAVQAMVSARNFGIDIDKEVLDKGFEYLKKCQNKDGGFDYMLGPGEVSMKEGTAADVATLALMEKFDYAVMINGFKFLTKITPATISRERFPYYGHFYGCMGMRLLGEEFKPYRKQTQGYINQATADLLDWQQADGTWPIKSWMKGKEDAAYSTAFASLALSVHDGRLSIFCRTPPKLPAEG